MNKNEFEENIPYIVRLKENFIMSNTAIRRTFCGFLVNHTDGKFFFELNGSRMLVIVSYAQIEWMAPSKVHHERFVNTLEKTLDKNKNMSIM
jgi:hypothetical protein